MRGRNRKGPNPVTRSYESNGGDVKIRGTAVHVAEKYVQLARDAQAAGDRVVSEHYLQHAEHYFRIVAAAQAHQQQQAAARAEAAGDLAGDARANGGNVQSAQPASQPTIGPDDPQPYASGNGAGETDPQDTAPLGGDASPAGGTPAPEAAETAADDSGDRLERAGRGPRGPRRRPAYRDRSARSEGAPSDPPVPSSQADEQ